MGTFLIGLLIGYAIGMYAEKTFKLINKNKNKK